MKVVITCAHKILRIIYKLLSTKPDLSKRKGARTEETVLTPKLKKFQLQYSTGSDFLRFFTVFFQIKEKSNSYLITQAPLIVDSEKQTFTRNYRGSFHIYPIEIEYEQIYQ